MIMRTGSRKQEAGVRGLALVCLSACFMARAEVAPSQTIRLAWDYANPTGFVFYVKQRVGLATNTIAVVTNANQVTISNVVPSQYEWSVTASNMWGESDPSVPFITPAKPVTPGQLRPISTTFRVVPPVSFEKTADLLSWEERFRLFKPDSNGVQIVMQTIRPEEGFTFYRVRATPTPGAPR